MHSARHRGGRERLRIPTLLFGILCCSVAILGLTGSGNASAATTALPGNVSPLIKHAIQLGATDPNTRLSLAIALTIQDRGELDAFNTSLNDPNSPGYHHYLTPAEFTAKFAPTAADVASFVSYLQNQGFTNITVAPNRLVVNVTATVGQAEQTFGVHINNYRNGSRTFYANDDDPQLPPAYAGLVQGIMGLDDAVQLEHHMTMPQTPSQQKATAFLQMLRPSGAIQPHVLPTHGYVPSDLSTAYDITPLKNAGWKGQGQTIAFMELDGYSQSDVNAYYTNLGIEQPANSTVLVDSFSGTPGGGAVEVELDMELAGGIASKAPQIVYEAPNTTTGEIDNYNKMVNDNKASIISTSWGLCEAVRGTTNMRSLNNIFIQARAQGESIFAASGDAGAYDCQDTNLSVDFPASSSNVIGVGGTALTGTSPNFSETAWSASDDNLRGPKGAGSGGGLSTAFLRPDYQLAPGVINASSNGLRQVPDVSMAAANGTTAATEGVFAVYCTVSLSGCSSSAPWVAVGGTSGGSPIWAASTAIIGQYLTLNNNQFQENRVGFFSPALYHLASSTQKYAPFHDITTGNNLFYNATTGYDYATGLGTPDVTNIAYDLAHNFYINDTFTRPNQTFWGTPINATAAYQWGGDAATNSVFSINSNVGQVSGGNTTYHAPIATTNTDVQVYTIGSSSVWAAPNGPNLGVLLCYKDSSDFYKAYIDGASFIIQKKVAGTFTTLSSTAFTATANTKYAFRVQDIGGVISGKVWNASTSEPSGWTSTVTDTTFLPFKGDSQVGLDIQDNNSAVVRVSNFAASRAFSSTLSGSPINLPTFTSQDTFARSNQTFWGTATDGNTWGNDAATNSAFTISGNSGVITGGTGQVYGTLGSAAANQTVLATVKVSAFTGGATAGVLARFVDANHWYRAYINGSSLVVQKNTGTPTDIVSIPFTASANTLYNLKFQVIGQEFAAKVWAASAQEPISWMVTTTDNAVTGSGTAGVSTLNVSGVTDTYTYFHAETPVVTALGQDTFSRANQTFWGTATDGNAWTGQPNSDAIFSIVSNTGQVSGGTTQEMGGLGLTTTDGQAFGTVKLSNFSSGSANAGVVMRYQDANHWYNAFLNGTSLEPCRHR